MRYISNSMDYLDYLGEEISLSYGLALTYDLKKFILSDNKPYKIKTSKSISREFDKEKWFYLSEYLKKNPKAKIKDLEMIEDGHDKKYIFHDHKHYLSHQSFLRFYIKTKIKILLHELLKDLNIQTIVELGSGYGSKLIYLNTVFESLFDLKYIGLDISKNGLEISKHFSNLINMNLKTFCFDYRKKSFEKLNLDQNSLLITLFGLHYKKKFDLKDILDFINAGIQGGIHFEPCSNVISTFPDKLYSALSYKYIIYNNYTMEIYNAFEEAKDLGLLDYKIDKSTCGNGLLPGTWLIWKKII